MRWFCIKSRWKINKDRSSMGLDSFQVIEPGVEPGVLLTQQVITNTIYLLPVTGILLLLIFRKQLFWDADWNVFNTIHFRCLACWQVLTISLPNLFYCPKQNASQMMSSCRQVGFCLFDAHNLSLQPPSSLSNSYIHHILPLPTQPLSHLLFPHSLLNPSPRLTSPDPTPPGQTEMGIQDMLSSL